MKKESPLKKFGKVVALSAGLFFGAQDTGAADVNEVHSHADDMFGELGNAHAKGVHESHKQALPQEQKDKKGGDMFEAMGELEVLDNKYMEFKHWLKAEGKKDEVKKDEMRQEIARVALMSGHSKEILQKGGAIANMRVGNGYWIINAQSDGGVVTGSIVSRNEKEKSMFAFSLR